MKKVNVFLTTTILFICLSSCKNDDDSTVVNPPPPPQATNADYLPDNNANYWVYEVYRVDSSGVETFLGNDTMTVKDTLMNGLAYKKYNNNPFPGQRYSSYRFMRDSSGYMIDPSGNIVFAVNPLNTVLRTDSIGNVYVFSFEMKKESGSINLPAGSFTDVLNYRNKVEFDSRVTPPLGMPQTRYYDNQYANKVGLIFTSYAFVSVPDLHRYEKRLVSYNIVP